MLEQNRVDFEYNHLVNVAVIGLGYVGLNTAISALSAGHEVVGIDSNSDIVEGLNSGISHIEGVEDAHIRKGILERRFFASSDFSQISSSEVIILAVPTPLDSNGAPDTSFLFSALESAAPYLQRGSLLINESTSYIGTLRKLISNYVLQINPKVEDFAVSPERIDPGNKTFNLSNTPRLVGGISDRSLERARLFYSTFCKNVISVSSPEIAEASKLLENTFRFVNISFINEFARLMSKMSIPVSEVIQAASTKPYGFLTFFPNVGIGGHCIPIDPKYLQKNAIDQEYKMQFIELSDIIASDMPVYFVRRLEELVGNLHGKRVLLVGVTYKPNVSDIRESPAKKVIDLLKSKGAEVSWHDPLVINYFDEKKGDLKDNYDFSVVLVKHDSISIENWNTGIVYCVNPIASQPDWIPVLGTRE